ncbi:MAG: DUF3021 domain-containing protein [Lachnospiraceae bacterium]|nr:DUF3021 domain-containing protein [Lachnospiraceae bacterium]
MNKLVKKTIILGVSGFFLGIFVGMMISLLTGPGSFDEYLDSVSFFYLFVGGVHGLICMAGTIVYDIEKWSIAGATFTHFVLCMTCFCLLGWIQGWLEFGSALFWTMTVMEVLAYFIVWLIMYLTYRRKVGKLNEDLARAKGK